MPKGQPRRVHVVLRGWPCANTWSPCTTACTVERAGLVSVMAFAVAHAAGRLCCEIPAHGSSVRLEVVLSHLMLSCTCAVHVNKSMHHARARPRAIRRLCMLCFAQKSLYIFPRVWPQQDFLVAGGVVYLQAKRMGCDVGWFLLKMSCW